MTKYSKKTGAKNANKQMYPNQGQNPLINQGNHQGGNGSMRNLLNLGNIASTGNVANLFNYPFQMIPQQYQQSIMRTQSQMIPQQMPRADPKQPAIPPPYPYMQPNMPMQPPINKAFDECLLAILNLNDDQFQLFCKLFEIQPVRESFIQHFKIQVWPRLMNQEVRKSLLFFLERYIHHPEIAICFKEPLIPRVFNRNVVIEPRYFLIQNHSTSIPFAPLFLPPPDSFCIGQFICSSLKTQPVGSVAVNGTELVPMNFGEFAQFYLLKRKTEDLSPFSIQISSTHAERNIMWFVITYYSPKHNFVNQYFSELKRNSDDKENLMVRTEKCIGCPSFPLEPAIEKVFHTGFLTCPFCDQHIQFDQLIFEKPPMPNSAPINESENDLLKMGRSLPLDTNAKKPKQKRTRVKASVVIPLANTPPILASSQQQQNQQGVNISMRTMNPMVPVNQMNDNLNQPYQNIPPYQNITPGNQMGMACSGMGVAIPMFPSQPNKPQHAPLTTSSSVDGRLSPSSSGIQPNTSQNNAAPTMLNNGQYTAVATSNQVPINQQVDVPQQPAKKQKQKSSVRSLSQTSLPSKADGPNEPIKEKRVEIPSAPQKADINTESLQLRKSRVILCDFLCAQLKCAKNETNWTKSVFDEEGDLDTLDSEFKIKDYQDDQEYLEYADSFNV